MVFVHSGKKMQTNLRRVTKKRRYRRVSPLFAAGDSNHINATVRHISRFDLLDRRAYVIARRGIAPTWQSPKGFACQIGAPFSSRDCHGASPLAMTWNFLTCSTNDSPFYQIDHETGSMLLRPDVPVLLPDSMVFLL